ncbi:MAG: hypothetical protein OQK47_06565 [Gammaproteobacteria bacterium]|nr:hypothetical protein [Gammaproteobacteria bacterium]
MLGKLQREDKSKMKPSPSIIASDSEFKAFLIYLLMEQAEERVIFLGALSRASCPSPFGPDHKKHDLFKLLLAI